MKPNIFNIATKELSQDAFITWLLLFADEGCKREDEAQLKPQEEAELNELARVVLADTENLVLCFVWSVFLYRLDLFLYHHLSVICIVVLISFCLRTGL